MKELIQKLGKRVMGILSGFDRILFRGFVKGCISERGLNGYLYGAKVAMTDFEKHAQQVTNTVIRQSLTALLAAANATTNELTKIAA